MRVFLRHFFSVFLKTSRKNPRPLEYKRLKRIKNSLLGIQKGENVKVWKQWKIKNMLMIHLNFRMVLVLSIKKIKPSRHTFLFYPFFSFPIQFPSKTYSASGEREAWNKGKNVKKYLLNYIEF
jgi:hypothetical protein